MNKKQQYLAIIGLVFSILVFSQGVLFSIQPGTNDANISLHTVAYVAGLICMPLFFLAWLLYLRNKKAIYKTLSILFGLIALLTLVYTLTTG